MVDGGPLFDRAMTFYRNTYGLSDALARRVERVVLIRVSQAAPLTSPIYDTGATEDDVVRRYVAYYEGIRKQRTARQVSRSHPAI
jgi:hypothetical protein